MYMFLCLPNFINPVYIQQLTDLIFPPMQNDVVICKQITLLTFC